MKIMTKVVVCFVLLSELVVIFEIDHQLHQSYVQYSVRRSFVTYRWYALLYAVLNCSPKCMVLNTKSGIHRFRYHCRCDCY